jgi:hypothetical protein
MGIFRNRNFIETLMMRSVLIDTNAYVAFKRGDPKILKVLGTVDDLCMILAVLGGSLARLSMPI